MATESELSELRRSILSRAMRSSGATSVDQLLFDPVTSLPGLRVLVPRLNEALGSRGGVGLLAVSIAHFSKLEEVYGWETFDEIVRGFAACLKAVKDESLRKDDTLAELTINGNVFILMLSAPRTRQVIGYRDLERIKTRVTAQLNAYVQKTLARELLHRFKFFIGCAVLRRDPAIRLERQLYGAIDEALLDAGSERQRLLRHRKRSVRTILQRRRVHTVFQPILRLDRREIVGFEALSRGPRGEFESPDVLFRAAYEAELVLQLDRLCHERALRGLRDMGEGQLLFINMEPLSLFDPTLAVRIPAKHAARVVFEITEHAAISDFTTFRQAVQLVKAGGFKLALDDVGSAYSGLRLIAEIEPDYIKLDMELTRAVHDSRLKMELVRAVAQFCEGAELPMIVEGIETARELETVADLGCMLVQGYFLGRPATKPSAASVAYPGQPIRGRPKHSLATSSTSHR